MGWLDGWRWWRGVGGCIMAVWSWCIGDDVGGTMCCWCIGDESGGGMPWCGVCNCWGVWKGCCCMCSCGMGGAVGVLTMETATDPGVI